MNRQEVIMPGAVELIMEAERHIRLGPFSRLLSVACGTGEIELYLARKFGCSVLGIDIGDWAVRKATDKAVKQGLPHLARFEVGDGAHLRCEAAGFDVVLCSGAICEFFDPGIRAFHRALKPGGRAVIVEVIWRKEGIPPEVELRWTEGRARISTLAENERLFGEKGFRSVLAREYHEPQWWESYYDDRGTAPNWQDERMNYSNHKDYVGLGLFVLEKE
jgi:ubiquinone/menaquinone biosynthesis C-methylase UbiE